MDDQIKFPIPVNSVIETEEEETCCICLMPVEMSLMASLSCGHNQFHFDCILQWANISSNCPYCKQEVSCVSHDGKDTRLKRKRADVPAQEEFIDDSEGDYDEEDEEENDYDQCAICDDECIENCQDSPSVFCDCGECVHLFCIGRQNTEENIWTCVECVRLGRSSRGSSSSHNRPVLRARRQLQESVVQTENTASGRRGRPSRVRSTALTAIRRSIARDNRSLSRMVNDSAHSSYIGSPIVSTSSHRMRNNNSSRANPIKDLIALHIQRAQKAEAENTMRSSGGSSDGCNNDTKSYPLTKKHIENEYKDINSTAKSSKPMVNDRNNTVDLTIQSSIQRGGCGKTGSIPSSSSHNNDLCNGDSNTRDVSTSVRASSSSTRPHEGPGLGSGSSSSSSSSSKNNNSSTSCSSNSSINIRNTTSSSKNNSDNDNTYNSRSIFEDMIENDRKDTKKINKKGAHMIENDRKDTNKINKKCAYKSINNIQGNNPQRSSNSHNSTIDAKTVEKEGKNQGKKKFKSSLLNDIPVDCLGKNQKIKQSQGLGGKKSGASVSSRGDFDYDRNRNSGKNGYDNLQSNYSNFKPFSAARTSKYGYDDTSNRSQGEVYTTGLANTGISSISSDHIINQARDYSISRNNSNDKNSYLDKKSIADDNRSMKNDTSSGSYVIRKKEGDRRNELKSVSDVVDRMIFKK